MSRLDDVKISGKYVLAYVEGVAEVSSTYEDKALNLLEENGISDPQPDETYSSAAFAKALEAMVDSVGPATTRKIATKVVEAAPWPPEVDSVEAAFEVNKELLHELHMNADEGDIGNYRFEKTGDKSGRAAATEAYPYPVPFVEGIFEGILDKFSSSTSISRLSEIDAQSDEKCAYEVTW